MNSKSNYKEYNVFIINPKFELEQLSDLVGDSKTAIIMRTGYQLEVEKGDAWKENLTQWVERVSNINPRIQLFFIVTETKKKTRTEMAASRILMELTRKFSPRAQYAFVQIYVNDSYRKLFSRM